MVLWRYSGAVTCGAMYVRVLECARRLTSVGCRSHIRESDPTCDWPRVLPPRGKADISS